MLRASLALLVLVGCSKPDESKDAVARLARLWTNQSRDGETQGSGLNPLLEK